MKEGEFEEGGQKDPTSGHKVSESWSVLCSVVIVADPAGACTGELLRAGLGVLVTREDHVFSCIPRDDKLTAVIISKYMEVKSIYCPP